MSKNSDDTPIKAKIMRHLGSKTTVATGIGAATGGWIGSSVGIAALGGAVSGLLPLAALGGGAAYLITKNAQLRRQAREARAAEKLASAGRSDDDE